MKWIFVALLIAARATAGPIEDAVDRVTGTPPFQRALWFIHVEDEKGTVVFERDANRLAIPASVRKLASAASVSECIGADARLQTELWQDGEDLIVRGDGDPSFGSDRYGFYDQAEFAPFIRALRARGIRRVRNIVADVSRFDRVLIPYQWKVGNLTTDSAAPVDALAWDENELPDQYPVASPALFFAGKFRAALIEGGIEVTGVDRVQYERREWPEKIAVIESPYLYQLLTTVLKPSHNLFAEMLYKRTSAEGSYTEARATEAKFLTGIGLEESEFRFVDGSGLAPDDLVTALGVVKVLRWMYAPVRRGIWWDLLAEPGSVDGSLRRRLLPLSGRMRAKTGSVAGVNSLAGIVRGRNGGHRLFAIMINHHIGSGSVAVRSIDEIVSAIADF